MRLEHAQDPNHRPATNGSSRNGLSHSNGDLHHGAGEHETNGFHVNGDGFDSTLPNPFDTTPFYGHDREEVTRILLQGLSDLGYRQTAAKLVQESGFELEIASVAAFRSAVQRGEWEDAESLLLGSDTAKADGGAVLGNGLHRSDLLSSRRDRFGWSSHNGHSSRKGLPLADNADVPSLKFLLRQQKYLELLERRELTAAMNVLRNELTPLKRDTGRIHSLTRLLMCPTIEDLHAQLDWNGSQQERRGQLLSEVSKSISPSIMIPEHRLVSILSTAQREQIMSCRYHNTHASPSLYTDHQCSADDFPLETLTELRHHTDEVWYLEFSHDGSMLATAGKDGLVCVYDTNRWKLKFEFREHVRFKREGDGENAPEKRVDDGICYIAFSPNDQYLISCSKVNEFVVMNVRDGRRVAMADHFDYLVTSAAWLPDSETFVIGSQGSQRPLSLYSLREGASSPPSSGGIVRNNEIHSFRDPPWDATAKEPQPATFRVTACAVCRDGARMAATTLDNHLLIFDLLTRRKISDWQLEDKLTSVCFAPDDPMELLVSMNDGHVLALNAVTGEVVTSYEGVAQKQFVIRSAYGGAGHHLIVSGSEDSTVHIWRRETGASVAVLHAHSPGTVNAVAWHPTNPVIFASAGDDRRVRIWSSANVIRGASSALSMEDLLGPDLDLSRRPSSTNLTTPASGITSSSFKR